MIMLIIIIIIIIIMIIIIIIIIIIIQEYKCYVIKLINVIRLCIYIYYA